MQTAKSLVIKSVLLYNKVEFSDSSFLSVTSGFIVLTPRPVCSGPQFPRNRISDLMSCIFHLSPLLPAAVNVTEN